VRSLNAMLNDRSLFNEFQDYFPSSERQIGDNGYWCSPILGRIPNHLKWLGSWLICDLQKSGALENRETLLAESTKNELRWLNRIMLSSILKTINIDDFKGGYYLHPEKEPIISTLDKAGYTFVGDRELKSACFLLEFKRKK